MSVRFITRHQLRYGDKRPPRPQLPIVSGPERVTKSLTLTDMERLIRRDPARRGLIAHEEERGPLCLGHLTQAAHDLARNGQRVAIVTGFFIPAATPPAAETDGPPGAALLAAALNSIGLSATLITDEHCYSALETAAKTMNLPPSTVVAPGKSAVEIDAWFTSTVNDASQAPLTHLISIERVGPSHTRNSLENQTPKPDTSEIALFERLVPETDRNHCFNMRGICIDAQTAPLHRLFELASRIKTVKTIGIGDGGNEIGMGSIPWWELHHRLGDDTTAKIPCRIATDWTIVAGVSNWGAMALAAATLLLRDQQSNLLPWTARQQQNALRQLVAEGPAVDGITKLREATVDGLPFLTYIQPWEGIRRAIGLPPEP